MTSVLPTPAGSTTSGASLLEVDDLYVEFRTDYGVVHAVNGISYSLAAGE
jgi:oligopeptide transport system ATP-binding protein